MPTFNEILKSSLAIKGPTSPLGINLSTVNPADYKSQLGSGIRGSVDYLNYQRAEAQNFWESSGNFWARGFGKLALSIPETAGYIFDIPGWVEQNETFQNSLSEWARKQKEALDESMPEYSRDTHQDENFNPLSGGWWARNADSAVESLGYFIPGWALGKAVGAGLKFLGAAEKVAQAGSVLTATLTSNHAEGMQLAVDAYKNTYSSLISQGVSEAEARSLASDTAAKVSRLNYVMLGTDLLQMKALFKGFDSIRRGMSFNKSAMLSGTLDVLKQGAPEMGEELYQGAMQREQERTALQKAGLLKADGSNVLSRAFDYMISDQGLTEGFLGFVGGAGFGGVTTALNARSTARDRKLGLEQIVLNKQIQSNLLKKQGKEFENIAQSVEEGNEAKYDNAINSMMRNMAWASAERGVYNNLEEFVDNLDLIPQAEMEANGWSREEVVKRKQEFKEILNQTEHIYNKVQKLAPKTSGEFRTKMANLLIEQQSYTEGIKKAQKYSNELLGAYKGPEAKELEFTANKNLSARLSTLKEMLKNSKTDEGKAFLTAKIEAVEEEISTLKEAYKAVDKKFESPAIPLLDELLDNALTFEYQSEFKYNQATKEFEYYSKEKNQKAWQEAKNKVAEKQETSEQIVEQEVKPEIKEDTDLNELEAAKQNELKAQELRDKQTLDTAATALNNTLQGEVKEDPSGRIIKHGDFKTTVSLKNGVLEYKLFPNKNSNTFLSFTSAIDLLAKVEELSKTKEEENKNKVDKNAPLENHKVDAPDLQVLPEGSIVLIESEGSNPIYIEKVNGQWIWKALRKLDGTLLYDNVPAPIMQEIKSILNALNLTSYLPAEYSLSVIYNQLFTPIPITEEGNEESVPDAVEDLQEFIDSPLPVQLDNFNAPVLEGTNDDFIKGDKLVSKAIVDNTINQKEGDNNYDFEYVLTDNRQDQSLQLEYDATEWEGKPKSFSVLNVPIILVSTDRQAQGQSGRIQHVFELVDRNGELDFQASAAINLSLKPYDYYNLINKNLLALNALTPQLEEDKIQLAKAIAFVKAKIKDTLFLREQFEAGKRKPIKVETESQNSGYVLRTEVDQPGITIEKNDPFNLGVGYTLAWADNSASLFYKIDENDELQSIAQLPLGNNVNDVAEVKQGQIYIMSLKSNTGYLPLRMFKQSLASIEESKRKLVLDKFMSLIYEFRDAAQAENAFERLKEIQEQISQIYQVGRVSRKEERNANILLDTTPYGENKSVNGAYFSVVSRVKGQLHEHKFYYRMSKNNKTFFNLPNGEFRHQFLVDGVQQGKVEKAGMQQIANALANIKFNISISNLNKAEDYTPVIDFGDGVTNYNDWAMTHFLKHNIDYVKDTNGEPYLIDGKKHYYGGSTWRIKSNAPVSQTLPVITQEVLEVKPVEITADNSLEAKKADIERRRQEEIDNLFSQTQASTDKQLNTPVQKLSKEEVSKNIETAKQQNKDLIEELENPEFLNDEKRNDEWDKKADELSDKLPQGVDFRITDGKVDFFDSQSYREKGFGKNIVQVSVGNLHNKTEKFEVGDNLQVQDGARAIPAIVTKVNEHGKILEAKQEDGRIIISRGNIITLAPINNRLKINAKYDAELKALEQQFTTPNQSELEAKKADIKRRRKESKENIKLIVGAVTPLTKDRSGNDAAYQVTAHNENGKNKFPELHGIEGATKQEVIDKIDAKYDAELKALEQPNSELEAKKADIERRRQEELKNEIWNNSGTKFTGKSFVAKDGNTYTIEESELKSGDKVIKVKDKDGKTVSSAYFTKNEDGTYSIKKGTRVESKIQGIGLASAIYNYFDNNIGKIKRTDTTTDEGDNLWNSNKNRINAKYDALEGKKETTKSSSPFSDIIDDKLVNLQTKTTNKIAQHILAQPNPKEYLIEQMNNLINGAPTDKIVTPFLKTIRKEAGISVTPVVEVKQETIVVEAIIEQEVTEEEVVELQEELGVTVEEVKEVIKVETVKALNDKKPSKTKTLLQRIIARIKRIFLALFLVGNFMNLTSFNYPKDADVITYDNIKIENLESWNDLKLTQDEINKKENIEIITSFRAGTEDEYTIIDKTASVAHLYIGDSLITTYRVATGANIGDDQTVLLSTYYNPSGKEVSFEEATTPAGRLKEGYKAKSQWGAGNMQTGAGVYTISKTGPYAGARAFFLQNSRGITVSTAMHKAMEHREAEIAANDNIPTRLSNGCINFLANDLSNLFKRKDFGVGSKVYILPDDHNNKFKIVDGELEFNSSNPNVNRTINNYEPQSLVATVDDINDKGKEFLMSLSKNKADIMKLYPTVSNDVYNSVVSIAYGIFGQESSFGTYGGPRGQIGRVKDLTGIALNKNVSAGVSQVRISSLNEEVKKAFDINTTKDLLDVEKAAIGTISMLLDTYVNSIPNKYKADFAKLLPLYYNNPSEAREVIKSGKEVKNLYVKNVLDTASRVNLYTDKNTYDIKLKELENIITPFNPINDEQVKDITKFEGKNKAFLEYIMNNISQDMKPLAEMLMNNVSKLGHVKLQFGTSQTVGGKYNTETGELFINLTAGYRRQYFSVNEGLQNVLHAALHEYIHAYTLNAFLNPQTMEEKEFSKFIKDTFKTLKKDALYQSEYGFKSEEEFISEIMTNKDFQKMINKTSPSLWTRIKNFFAKLLGIGNKREALVDKTISTILGFIPKSNPVLFNAGEYNIMERQSHPNFSEPEEANVINILTGMGAEIMLANPDISVLELKQRIEREIDKKLQTAERYSLHTQAAWLSVRETLDQQDEYVGLMYKMVDNLIKEYKFKIKGGLELLLEEEGEESIRDHEDVEKNMSKSFLESNPFDKMSRVVKIQFLTLKSQNTFDLLGENLYENFKDVFPAIQRTLANKTTIEEKLENLARLAHAFDVEGHKGLMTIYERVEQDTSFRIKFFQAFNNNIHSQTRIKIMGDNTMRFETRGTKNYRDELINKWKNNFKSKNLPLLGNQLETKLAIFKQNINKATTNAELYAAMEDYYAMLDSLGITLGNIDKTRRAFETWLENPVNLRKAPMEGVEAKQWLITGRAGKNDKSLYNLFKSSSAGFIDTLKKDVNIYDGNLGGRFDILGDILGEFYLEHYDNMVETIKGEKMFVVNKPNQLSQFVARLNGHREEVLSEYDWLEYSNWKKALAGDMFIDYHQVEGIEKDGGDNVPFMNLTNKHKHFMAIAHFLEPYLTNKRNTSTFLLHLPFEADKTHHYLITAPRFKTVGDFFDLRNPSFNALVNTVKQEWEFVKRIREIVENLNVGENGEIDVSQMSQEDRVKYLIEPLVVERKKGKYFVGQGTKFHFIKSLNNVENITEDTIISHTKDYFTKIYKERKAALIAEGVIYKEKDKYVSKMFPQEVVEAQGGWDNVIRDFVINETIGLREARYFITGLDGEYKNIADEGKRMVLIGTPVQYNMDGEYNVLIIEDVLLDSSAINDIIENSGKTKEELAFFRGLTTNDGQGWCTINRYREILTQQGKNPESEAVLKVLDKIQKGTANALDYKSIVLNPIKGVFTKRIWDKKLGVHRNIFIKYSLYPLLPRVVKGTQLDQLRLEIERLEQNGNTVEVIPESAFKVGRTNVVRIHKENGDLDLEAIQALDKSSMLTLPNNGWGVQMDTPEKDLDNKGKMGVQIAKIILSNFQFSEDYTHKGEKINGQLLYNQYNQAVVSNLLEDLNNLLEEFGEDGGTLNDSKVAAKLTEYLKDRQKPFNVEGLLEVFNDEFVLPLQFNVSQDLFLPYLMSFFNKVREQSIPGQPYYQVASTFFKRVEGTESGIDYIDGYSGELGASFKDGVLTVDAIISPWASELIKDGKIDINKIAKEAPELLKVIGYRIPYSGKNYSVVLNIVGFSNKAAGDIVVVNHHLIASMGFDFDIDKMFVMARHIGFKDGKFFAESDMGTRAGRDNFLIDFFTTVLHSEHHVNEIFASGGFEDNIEQAEEYTIDIPTYDLNTGLGQININKANLEAVAMKGMLANDNGFLPVVQLLQLSTNNAVNVRLDGEVVALTELGGRGDYKGLNGRLIAEALGEPVNAVMDAAKTPTLSVNNINTYTEAVFNIFNLMGMEYYSRPFLQQWAIREYTKREETFDGVFEEKTPFFSSINDVRKTLIKNLTQGKDIKTLYNILKNAIQEGGEHELIERLDNLFAKDESGKIIGLNYPEGTFPIDHYELSQNFKTNVPTFTSRQQVGDWIRDEYKYVMLQLETLHNYNVFAKIGKALSKANQALSSDRKSPINLYHIFALRENRNHGDLTAVLNSVANGEVLQGIEAAFDQIKDGVITSQSVYKIAQEYYNLDFTALELLTTSSKFFTNSEPYYNAYQSLKKYLGITIFRAEEDEQMFNRVKSHLLSFINSQNFKLNELLEQYRKAGVNFFSDDFITYFTAEKEWASSKGFTVFDVLTIEKTELEKTYNFGVPYIGLLNPEQLSPVAVDTFSHQLSDIYMNNMDAYKLTEEEEVRANNLVELIMAYSYLTTGFVATKSTLSKILPFEFYTDNTNNVPGTVREWSNKEAGEVVNSVFMRRFARHNYRNSRISYNATKLLASVVAMPQNDKGIKANENTDIIKDSIILTSNPKLYNAENGTYKKFISISKISTINKKEYQTWKQYELIGTIGNKGVFIQVDLLGVPGKIMEMNTDNSSIPMNTTKESSGVSHEELVQYVENYTHFRPLVNTSQEEVEGVEYTDYTEVVPEIKLLEVGTQWTEYGERIIAKYPDLNESEWNKLTNEQKEYYIKCL